MNMTRLVTLVSLAILVGTEVAAAAVATAWALGGLFELGATITYGMMAVFLAFGGYIMLRFVQNAVDVEPLHD